jgi:hypothetical protein
MVTQFNGAELFICGAPFVTLFRFSSKPPLSALEWAPGWCIDTFTAQWRAARTDRRFDWAIAMTNYGGLILLDADGAVNEWDTGEGNWITRNLPLEQWIENIIIEGEAAMTE